MVVGNIGCPMDFAKGFQGLKMLMPSVSMRVPYEPYFVQKGFTIVTESGMESHLLQLVLISLPFYPLRKFGVRFELVRNKHMSKIFFESKQFSKTLIPKSNLKLSSIHWCM